MKIYVSFGQAHHHEVRGRVLNETTLCEIECDSVEDGREKAFEDFGDKFCTHYGESEALFLAKRYGWNIIQLPPNRWEMFHVDRWVGISADVAAYCRQFYPERIIRLG